MVVVIGIADAVVAAESVLLAVAVLVIVVAVGAWRSGGRGRRRRHRRHATRADVSTTNARTSNSAVTCTTPSAADIAYSSS